MSDVSERVAKLPPLQRALFGLEEARQRIAQLEAARSEPVAVVGLGCRLPGGVGSVAQLWGLLREGRCGVGEVPRDRWDVDAYFDPDPAVAGKMATRSGAFIEGVDQFDAAFFGISPREANVMDPQQRLLLEVAWEALEQAGIAPDGLAGSATGTFVGISTTDYVQRGAKTHGAASIDPHVGTGNAHSIAANRLSYVLGLRGPSMAVDTACSSSLVAVHLACQSLRSGESDLALAGGVNLLLLPETMVNFSQARMLSPDGRCKAFDAAADGYGRGEGCGVVVLRRLSDALADGGQVLAVIRGSAVNQDGRSNGLTAPNGPAQEEVIRRALAMAGIDPHGIDYVEAHGTGTPLGDPIELRALGRVLTIDRPRHHPLLVGSAKTNLGHLEAAAGIAGLMKTVLAVHHGEIPAHLHFHHPNPHITWDDLPIEIPTSHRPWPTNPDHPDHPRTAGISSFGFGGTNAHVIITQAPTTNGHTDAAPTTNGHTNTAPTTNNTAEATVDAPAGDAVRVVKVAARGEPALVMAAHRLADYVDTHPEIPLPAIAYHADNGRAELPDRLAVVADTHHQLAERLRHAAANRPTAGTARGHAATTPTPIAFLIPGQGSRLAGACADLYGHDPAITTVLDELATVLGPPDQLPLAALIHPGPDSSHALTHTEHAQPALYALALALAAWWRHHGIEPDLLLGHSVGAYAAAALAGVFTPTDGARLVATRGQLMAQHSPGGAMAAIAAPPDRITTATTYHPDHLAIAAINTPNETVIAGHPDHLDPLLDELHTHGIRSQRLDVTHAFHSPLITPVLQPLAEALTTLTLTAPHTPLISDSTGQPAGPDAATPAYWLHHTRHTVNFAAALHTLHTHGAHTLIELGPTSTLLTMARTTLPPTNLTLLPSLHPTTDPTHQLDTSLAHLWTTGQPIHWPSHTGPPPTTCPNLPTYPFQHHRHWLPNDPPPTTPTDRQAEDVQSADVARAPLIEPVDSWSELADMLVTVPADLRRTELLAAIRREVADVLGLESPAELPTDRGLFDLGLNSLMAVELVARLERAVGQPLPTTLALDHPTLERLADHLADLASELRPGRRARRTARSSFAEQPIAIVGIGCRFPGSVTGPEGFWDLLRSGTDAVVDVPSSRWDVDAFYDPDPDVPLRMNTRSGGFLTCRVDEFDAESFGISPREAISMDPQQRLLLEVAWEALEDAGVPVMSLSGTATGVFVGVNTGDYLQLLSAGGLPDIDAYTATGNTFSVAAGRLSYILGLRGPSLALDTACSSTLVAAHLACRSLHDGESDLAVVGGVNLMLSPATSVSLTKLRALSPDGRCKAFSAAADGYGRGEGCGVVVLKRLAEAVKDGDRIWATIVASAVNQDGRSAGLTVPNGPAQQALIEEALASGSIDPASVGYLEAHGTGTPLGDPIELQAIGATLARDRNDHPLLVGSVKTNIGHLEAAAGIAGLIKAALAVHHGEIPPNLHFGDPNPFVDWERLSIEVPTRLTAWPDKTRPRMAGISSFGFSGTNAHLVVGAGPAVDDTPEQDRPDQEPPARLLVLSARTPGAARRLADELEASLATMATKDDASPRFAQLCDDAATRRSHHDHRIALVARTPTEAAARLARHRRGDDTAGVVSGRALAEPPRVLFVFSGQGAQRPRMAARLLDDEPTFRETFMLCDKLVRQHAGWSAVEEMLAAEERSRLHETHIAQPVLFALQAALTALWRSWSVRPDAVIGHSVGEIAAAHAAGVLELEDAVRLVVERGRLMQPATGAGLMAVLGVASRDAEDLLAIHGRDVTIAARNGPRSTIISGPSDIVREVVDAAQSSGVFARLLPGAYGFHAPGMAPFADALADRIDWLRPRPPSIPMYSTVTGALLDDVPGPTHWGDNVRRPVEFEAAFSAAVTDRTVALEIGPHPVLVSALQQCLADLRDRVDGTVLGSMAHERDDREVLLCSVATLHVSGYPLDHRARCRRPRHAGGLMPTYAWQRERYWLAEARLDRTTAAAGQHKTTPAGDAVLDRQLRSMSASGGRYFEVDITAERHPQLFTTRVDGVAVLPLSGVADLVLVAARRELDTPHLLAHDLIAHRGVPLDERSLLTLQLVLTPADGGGYDVEVHAADGHADGTLAATGWVGSDVSDGEERPADVDPATLRARLDGQPPGGTAEAKGVGAENGTGRLVRWSTDDGTATVHVRLSDDVAVRAGRHTLHPEVIGAGLDVLRTLAGEDRALVAASFGRLRAQRPVSADAWLRVRTEPSRSGEVVGLMEVFDQSGACVADLTGVVLRAAEPATIRTALSKHLEGLLYDVDWEPAAPLAIDQPSGWASGTWVIVTDEGPFGLNLAAELERAGGEVIVAHRGTVLGMLDDRHWVIDPCRPDDVAKLLAAASRDPVRPVRGVVLLLVAGPTNDVVGEAERSACGLLHLIQALDAGQAGDTARLWVVTRGGQPTDTDDPPVRPWHAPVWGLGRVAMLEHPDRCGALIDLDPNTIDDVRVLAAELASRDDEDQVAYRAGRRRAVRLVPRPADSTLEALQLRPDASYVVTGGRGSLGLKIAQWLIDRGARHLVLTGRRPLPERSTWSQLDRRRGDGPVVAAIEAMETRGVVVHTPVADVTDKQQMAAIFGSSARPAIRGVVHAAGVFTPRPLADTTDAQLRAVLAPKVHGTWLLHELTRDLDLDLFVLFSSAAATWGSALAGHYVAANHFLDLVAHHRRSQGLPALSVDWGWWAESEMAASELQTYFHAIGLGVVEEALGFVALEHLLAANAVQCTVAPVDWTRFKPIVEAKRRRPFLDRLTIESVATTVEPSAEGLQLVRQLGEAPASSRRGLVEQFVQHHIADVLRLPRSRPLDPHAGFFESGMDSITTVELKTRLETSLGATLPATIAFEYPNVSDLASFLLVNVLDETDDGDPPADASAVADAALADLSEDELLAALAEELADR